MGLKKVGWHTETAADLRELLYTRFLSDDVYSTWMEVLDDLNIKYEVVNDNRRVPSISFILWDSEEEYLAFMLSIA